MHELKGQDACKVKCNKQGNHTWVDAATGHVGKIKRFVMLREKSNSNAKPFATQLICSGVFFDGIW